jgi:hypothetical protein
MLRWTSQLENKPVVLNKEDWKPEEFAVICKALNLEDNIQSIVIRENFILEYSQQN